VVSNNNEAGGGVEVEAEVVCVGGGAGEGIMFIASKCDFTCW